MCFGLASVSNTTEFLADISDLITLRGKGMFGHSASLKKETPTLNCIQLKETHAWIFSVTFQLHSFRLFSKLMPAWVACRRNLRHGPISFRESSVSLSLCLSRSLYLPPSLPFSLCLSLSLSLSVSISLEFSRLSRRMKMAVQCRFFNPRSTDLFQLCCDPPILVVLILVLKFYL